MNKTFEERISLAIASTIIVLLLILLVFFIEAKFLQPVKKARVCFKEQCFLVEIADTPLKQQQGLMFRDHLDKDKGMLFVFKKEGDYPFWMKNTLIPLDMIWINQNQEVVFIKENAEPCKEICNPIDPQQIATYVLEINAGIAGNINLKLGDKVSGL